MCCSENTSGSRMTRCGIVCGLAALAALTTALLGPAWLHTEEKLSLPHLPRQLASAVSVKFKLGLFKVCPRIIKPANITLHIITPPCTNVRYNSLADVTSQELGFNQLDFTPLVVSKMRFKNDHPDFIGAKVIFSPINIINTTSSSKIYEYIKKTIEMKNKFPDLFAGFDLVGHENRREPLKKFVKQLTQVTHQIKFFFHAGETNWYGFNSDENLLDAVLLNTTRIGHGSAILKHPEVLKLARQKNIPIEVCPISNQVLKLVTDLRNHPAGILFAENYPVVISNDDVGLWGSKGLSYDFYEAFMGIMSRNADIKPLKQLAINSIIYSAMNTDEKQKAYGIWSQKWIEFIDKVNNLKISAPFQAVAVVLIFAGTFSALIGHCYADHKTVIACGLFLLGGLSLGGGLIVLASALSDASFESPTRYSLSSTSGSTEDNGLPKYQYGWCLQLSGLALILAEIAALLTVSGYMARFPTVEEMVQVMVPGAARKLREQRGLSSEYLVRAHQKSPGATQARNFDPPTKDVILGPQRLTEEGTSLLCKSAPDICASNPQAISYVDKADLSHMLPAYPDSQTLVDPRFTFVDKADPGIVDSRLSGFADKEGLMDSRILPDSRQNMIAFNDSKEHVISQETRHVTYAENTKNECLLDAPLGFNRYNSLAGQTVPITLKHQNSPTVSAIQAQAMYQNFGTIHSGILRVSEPGTSSSSNSSQRSMTLQNPKRKSQIAQNTFSTLECEKRKQRATGVGGKAGFYTGSAV